MWYGAGVGGTLCNTYDPTLGLSSCTFLHTRSDEDQMRNNTQHKHTTNTTTMVHGGGAANPSGGVDLMNPCHPRGRQPCTYLCQGLH
jgi:hypothetical protein